MEREFTDYDEWMRYGGDPTYGQGVSTIQRGEVVGQMPSTPPSPTPSIPPPTTGGGGRNPNAGPNGSNVPNMDPPGYMGGYWMDGQWVQGSPRSGGDHPGGGSDQMFGASNPNEGFKWPTYNAPRFSYGEFGGFKPFKAPTMDEILADPVLQSQLTEGRRSIKGDRAFRGILNTGDTLKDIFDWTGDRVKLGANDAFERAFKVYDVNERQNPFNTWNANRGLALDTFNANAPQVRDEFFYNQYEPARQTFDDNFRRWQSQGNWLTDAARPVD